MVSLLTTIKRFEVFPMKQQTLDPRSVAITAVMTAVILIVTALVQIPTPVVGYIHLGDAPIFFTSIDAQLTGGAGASTCFSEKAETVSL